MTQSSGTREQVAGSSRSPWPFRIAVLLSLVTFPLIFVGGLVTTQQAGMAVPDWPGTYGYNLFLYPIEDWWPGPYDLFIEHGHRLLGSLAGLVTIALLIVTLLKDSRRWVKLMAFSALVLVIAQGLLGGVRVLAADRAIAMVHGCVGPAFFAFCVAIACVTSAFWMKNGDEQSRTIKPTYWAWAVSMVVVAYMQLVLGANLRHIAVEADPIVHRSLTIAHVTGAILTVFHAMRLAQLAFQGDLGRSRRVSVILMLLVFVQFALGVATWSVKFGIPEPYNQWSMFAGFVVEAQSLIQANIVTAHVATGSLILATSVWLMLKTARQTSFSTFGLRDSTTGQGVDRATDSQGVSAQNANANGVPA